MRVAPTYGRLHHPRLTSLAAAHEDILFGGLAALGFATLSHDGCKRCWGCCWGFTYDCAIGLQNNLFVVVVVVKLVRV
jgi:hypothetical protein